MKKENKTLEILHKVFLAVGIVAGICVIVKIVYVGKSRDKHLSTDGAKKNYGYDLTVLLSHHGRGFAGMATGEDRRFFAIVHYSDHLGVAIEQPSGRRAGGRA